MITAVIAICSSAIVGMFCYFLGEKYCMTCGMRRRLHEKLERERRKLKKREAIKTVIREAIEEMQEPV